MYKLISRVQNGFLKGRFMGGNIRLVYHLMNNTERKNISGWLILIDSEKASDSTSWEFVFNTDISRYWIQISHFIETPGGILRELDFCW